jgi:DNA-3-methyladenine glycosylase II
MNQSYSLNTISEGIDFLKSNDEVMSNIIREIGGFKLRPRTDSFQFLIKIIIGQQLSIIAADSIFNRLILKVGELNPKILLETSDQTFKETGLSKNKINSIRHLSQLVADNHLNLEEFKDKSDEIIFERLIAVKGIGPWTIYNYLIFVLVRVNVLPIGDAAFERAIKIHYNFKRKPSHSQIIKISKKWGIYRSIASWYLWETINRKMIK